MHNEKRKHKRFDIPQIFKIEFSHEVPFDAKGINISEGGLLCETDYEIAPLSRVFITFILPEPSRGVIHNEGSVLRVSRKGGKLHFAVSFGEMSDEDRDELRKYLKN